MELGIGLTKIIPPVAYFCGIIIIFLTLSYKIEIGIYYIVPLLTLQNIMEHMAIYPGGKDFMDILFLTILLKWLMNRDKTDLIMKSNIRLNVVILTIVVWTYIELWLGSFNLGLRLPISLDEPRFVRWKNFVMLPILYLIVVNNIKTPKQVKIVLILMAASMLFMDRNFYHNFQGKDTSHFSKNLRVGATFSYLGPNETAVFYAQNTIIVVCLFLADKNNWRKLVFGGTLVFNYFCLLFLYSRGGYLASLASLIFYGLIKNRVLLISLVVLLIFWRTFAPISVQERIEMSQTEEGTDHSITARFEEWDEAAYFIMQNPILGKGYATTPYLNITTDITHYRKSLHNGHLELLLELGVIGAILFIWFYAISISYALRLYREAKEPFLRGYGLGFAGCIIAVLVGNFAGSYLFYFNVSAFFWVNLALIARCLEIEKKSGATETPKVERESLSRNSYAKGHRPWTARHHKLRE